MRFESKRGPNKGKKRYFVSWKAIFTSNLFIDRFPLHLKYDFLSLRYHPITF